MFKRTLFRLSMVLVLSLLAACGSGSSGSSSTQLPAPSVSYSSATLKIDLIGTLPSGTAISGVNFTLFLLPELTPAMANGAVATGVVTPSGIFAGGLQTEPVFTPAATATSYGNLMVTLADMSQTGVTQLGEVAKITLLLPNHSDPAQNSYILNSNGVFDLAGNPITTVRAVVSEVTLK